MEEEEEYDKELVDKLREALEKGDKEPKERTPIDIAVKITRVNLTINGEDVLSLTHPILPKDKEMDQEIYRFDETMKRGSVWSIFENTFLQSSLKMLKAVENLGYSLVCDNRDLFTKELIQHTSEIEIPKSNLRGLELINVVEKLPEEHPEPPF